MFIAPTRYAASYVILAGVVVALIHFGMLLRLETRFTNAAVGGLTLRADRAISFRGADIR